jgi:hypothetical protein
MNRVLAEFPDRGRHGSIWSRPGFASSRVSRSTAPRLPISLQEHIDAFIAAYNTTAQPFAWTKGAAVQESPYHSAMILGTRERYR